jgi:hypothetical protein
LESDGTVGIGPLPASFGFRGPFSSPVQYFLSWAESTRFRKPEFLQENPHDLPTLKVLKREARTFPGDLALAMEEIPPSSCKGYPIVHRDFLPHNILFDDEYNIVGVIDWENAHSAPLQVFAALTNMYSSFDQKILHVVPSEDGKAYIKDIMHEEEKMQLTNKISLCFGSILGDLSHCMYLFEEGRVTHFSRVIKRYTGK